MTKVVIICGMGLVLLRDQNDGASATAVLSTRTTNMTSGCMPFRPARIYESQPATANVMTIGDGWGTGLGKFGWHVEPTMYMKVVI